MKEVMYDNKPFLEVFEGFAMRPHKSNRVEVLSYEVGGEVKCVSESTHQKFYKTLKSTFKARGLA